MTKKPDGPRGKKTEATRPKPKGKAKPAARPGTRLKTAAPAKRKGVAEARPKVPSSWGFATPPPEETLTEKGKIRRQKREAAKLKRKTTGGPRVHKKPRKGAPPETRPAAEETRSEPDLNWRRAENAPKPIRAELGKPALEPLPDPGSWIFLCREGFEQDLADELVMLSKSIGPHVLARGLLATKGKPPRPERRVDVTFARQAFPLTAAMREADPNMLAGRAARALLPLLTSAARFALHTFVPDSESGNRLSQAADALHEAIGERLLELDPSLAGRRDDDAREAEGLLAQVCLARADVALVGVMSAAEAPSRMPGGRARMKVGPHAPSRAAMKVEEALEWLGVGPDPGDLCIDLGAAPGGWTLQLVERGARVVAVDPAKLAPWVMKQKNVVHVPKNAFNFEPDEPVDWLFCDMVWRPLEVAGLLAKWGRWRKARVVVANIKLPMDRKAEFVRRVREILEGGGWKDLRTRHLYHDRDEITLTAWMR